jgi:hypothetical protein
MRYSDGSVDTSGWQDLGATSASQQNRIRAAGFRESQIVRRHLGELSQISAILGLSGMPGNSEPATYILSIQLERGVV